MYIQNVCSLVAMCAEWSPVVSLFSSSFASLFFSSCLSLSHLPVFHAFFHVCLSLSLIPFLMTLAPHRYQAKVRELEEKCRTQSEQFNLLSKELEKFRLTAGKFDILSTEPLTVCESPGSPNKSLSQLLNGLAAPIGKGK